MKNKLMLTLSALFLVFMAGAVFADPDEKEDDDNSGMNPYYRVAPAR